MGVRSMVVGSSTLHYLISILLCVELVQQLLCERRLKLGVRYGVEGYIKISNMLETPII